MLSRLISGQEFILDDARSSPKTSSGIHSFTRSPPTPAPPLYRHHHHRRRRHNQPCSIHCCMKTSQSPTPSSAIPTMQQRSTPHTSSFHRSIFSPWSSFPTRSVPILGCHFRLYFRPLGHQPPYQWRALLKNPLHLFDLSL